IEHAVRAEKRTAAELESDDIRELAGYAAGVVNDFVMSGLGTPGSRGGAAFASNIFLDIFEIHGLRSWFVSGTAGASLEGGLKEETHRQVASGGGLETFSSFARCFSTRRKRK